MKKLLLIFSILLILFILFSLFYSFAPRCEWIITNCCPENGGAYWECVNVKTYKQKLNCEEVQVICPQIPSPKPNLSCVLENNACVVK
jgi:hypothetical protein